MKNLVIFLCILCSSLLFIIQYKICHMQMIIIKIHQQIELTVEQAKELLIKYNNKVDYIYQGDANDFEYLKSKKLQGYVFLPNVDTDIGYFVDKQTSKYTFSIKWILKVSKIIKKIA